MLIEDITSKQFSWVRHDLKTLRSDYEEYKVKEESKWLGRAHRMGFRFPIFDSFEQYADAIQTSPIIDVDDALWDKVVNLSKSLDLDDLTQMVKTYTVPRDVERIKRGIEQGAKLPYPVILRGDEGYHIMSGNTRLNVARLMGVKTQAILIDVR